MRVEMDTRAKITHLLNRLGLGANEQEIDALMPYGADGAARKLINYEHTPDRFPVDPTELVLHDRDANVSLEPHRYALWWILRMAATQRPLEEKMTLFWHNHFAVSGAKVEFGPAMLDYLNILRKHAVGNFSELTYEISRSPAMLHWLDAEISHKTHPNENFGRELMELFTLGIGNYTEKDVKEVSRCFTTWGVRYPYYELGKMPERDKVMKMSDADMPMIAFTECPYLADTGPKTVLGVTRRFDDKSMIQFLCENPITAKRLMKKLWAFMAYENPEDKVVDHLANKFVASKLEMKPVLAEMVSMPEFWSDRAVGTMIKSPVSFTIGAMRQFKVGEHFLGMRAQGATYETPLNAQLVGQLYGAFTLLHNQGLAPLFPPDVSGWRWGSAWVGASAMLERQRIANYLYNGTKQGRISSKWIRPLNEAAKGKDSEWLVDRVCETMTITLPKAQKDALVESMKKKGVDVALKDPKAKTPPALIVQPLIRVLAASPEYQLC
ncbi:MAG: DUF1800 domain-containing protein [Armatimonadetes bacterium]|nr:DUF1800 domain-containing protein [Armatimonadota bacterium]